MGLVLLLPPCGVLGGDYSGAAEETVVMVVGVGSDECVGRGGGMRSCCVKSPHQCCQGTHHPILFPISHFICI